MPTRQPAHAGWILGFLMAFALLCVGMPGLRRAWTAEARGFPPPVAYPQVCTRTDGAVCSHAVWHALQTATFDQTGATLHWPPQWARDPSAVRLFIAINLERLAFHRPPIAAMTPALNRIAAQGAQRNHDPVLPDTPTVSVWAQAPQGINALFLWLFDDGYASPNAACGTWNLAGCWAHRANLLTVAAPGGRLISGIAVQPDPSIGSQSVAWIAEAVSRVPAGSLTWASIRHRYPPGTSPITRARRPLPVGTVLWLWVSRLGLIVVILGLVLRAAWQSGVLGMWLPGLIAWWSD